MRRHLSKLVIASHPDHKKIHPAVILYRFIKIHRALGPGLFATICRRILAYEIRKIEFDVQTKVPIPVEWDGHEIDEGFRADL